MYFPVNAGGKHWAPIVLRAGRLYLLDSMQATSILDTAAMGIINWMTRFYIINNFPGLVVTFPQARDIHRLSCPQQKDGWSCGWYKLFYARLVL
jgi:Ulp1 family protease